jgi:SAM-dependent methyltransferase
MERTIRNTVEHPRRIVGRLRDCVLYPLRKDRELLMAAEVLAGTVALEPGGQSALFGRCGLVPVYQHLAVLDTLDYTERTLWSPHAPHEITPRRHLIAEATQLTDIPDASYDLLLASHVLEHIANPLRALEEWRRVVRPSGHILLIMPHRDNTFDHRRAITTLEHMREDAARGTDESDLSHLEESLRLHDLKRNRDTKSRRELEQHLAENLARRSIHHHVFVSRSVVEMCRAAGLEVLLLKPKRPYHIVCLCRVSANGALSVDLDEDRLANILDRSPFPSDRREAPANFMTRDTRA